MRTSLVRCYLFIVVFLKTFLPIIHRFQLIFQNLGQHYCLTFLKIVLGDNNTWLILFFNLDLRESFNLTNPLSVLSITNLMEHLGHACLLYPENFSPQPPRHFLNIGRWLTFKFDEIKLIPKGKPVFIFSRPRSLLMCSKKPRDF